MAAMTTAGMNTVGMNTIGMNTVGMGTVTDDFVGRGWAFPLRVDSTGAFALSGGDEDVAESIRLILATSPGERPLRPEFGCPVHELIFDTVDAALAARVGALVEASLTRWEPRIDVLGVTAGPDPAAPHVLRIAVDYRISATNDRRNLVFPFYSIPED
jgi:phage baseplate assembly protein W